MFPNTLLKHKHSMMSTVDLGSDSPPLNWSIGIVTFPLQTGPVNGAGQRKPLVASLIAHLCSHDILRGTEIFPARGKIFSVKSVGA